MEITITTFFNPFSFFCMAKDETKDLNLLQNKFEISHDASTPQITNVQHGHYVAVMWQNKWTRGVITLESQFLIWLIDYGFYLRPNENTVYTDLPSEYKKYPTKVFEASIHGVAPIDKILSDECQIEDQISTTWNNGAVEKAQNIIASAVKTYFVPVAVLTTKHNDIVLGDLYLEIPGQDIVNIIDELTLWPIFLEKNKDIYVKNLSSYYTTSRRRHRACCLKPEIADDTLPNLYLPFSTTEYDEACANAPKFDKDVESSMEDSSSTVVDFGGRFKKKGEAFKLTTSEIEKYSQMYVTVNGVEFNVLNVLLNKIRDLNICEKYKDYDLKSVGCATSRPLFTKKSGTGRSDTNP